MIINTINDEVFNKEVKDMKEAKAFLEPLFKAEGEEEKEETAEADENAG